MTSETCWFESLCIAVFVAALAMTAAGCSSLSDDEAAQLTRAIAVTEGMTVADVGAGDGVLMPHLAASVGASGQVFLTEIESDKVAALRARATELGLEQVRAVQGTPTETRLDPNCCDAIVTRMVYHHFTDPNLFIESLHGALKPGGRLLVVDFHPSKWMSGSTPEDLPEDRTGHGVPPALVVREVEAKGFALQQQYDDWPGPGGMILNHFALVFIRE